MYDLVVVGAGPAGSRLASEASKRGFDVVVLERGEVGKPLACSGHLSGDIWDFLPESARSLIQNEIKGARFHAGGETYEFYKDETVSYAIDRVEMDKLLAREAEKNGAEVLTNHEVVDLKTEEDSVRAEVKGGKEFESRLLAGCDGPGSFVRKNTGMKEPKRILQGILAFSDENDDSDFVDVYLDIPDFFGWRIPRGDSVEYGAASSKHVKERFDRIVSPEEEIRKLCGGRIPVGPPEETVKGRVFLVGDAAGQVKPFTGGGIIYGMTSADIAADVMDPQDPKSLKDYERGWRRELGREIRLGNLLRKGYTAPPVLQRLGLSLFEGEINVHMDRPTTLFNRETARRVVKNAMGF
ncbi:MAG: geranylgeranyl reductase family protein [Halobacteria archaeon]|nr:geranylgeranyl reductase family protein [Halobacteria archaeon]